MSLCGPSNALSSLQKHASADRTLQQDRLRASSASSSSLPKFGNAGGNADGHLENDFERFSRISQPPIQQLSPQLVHSAAFRVPHQPAADGWAADFQRLHIAQHPAASPQATTLHHSSPMAATTQPLTNWHEEFMRQESGMEHFHIQGANVGYSSNYSPTFAGSAHPFGYIKYAQTNLGIGGEVDYQNQALADQFDDTAFEKAFEDAKATLESQSEAAAVPYVAPVDTAAEEELEAKEENKEEDPDELARTAAQLLESLSENKSKKFQDSTFLALMRRLRDREVKVEGDKMVEVR